MVSESELRFEAWLKDAINVGLFYPEYEKQFKVEMTPPVFIKIGKRKKNLVRGRKYTADFVIKPTTPKAYDIDLVKEISERIEEPQPIFYANKDGTVWVEVKCEKDVHKSTSIFSLRQSFLYFEKEIFVNKTIPYKKDKKVDECLFAQTFIPMLYLTKLRHKYQIRTAAEYVETRIS